MATNPRNWLTDDKTSFLLAILLGGLAWCVDHVADRASELPIVEYIVAGTVIAADYAAAEKQVVVVDPRGKAVPSDIVRTLPSPETPLGRTDATGKLVLPKRCPAGSVLRADPSAEYVTHGSTCTGQGLSIRIEVTPIEVLANLESNLLTAQKAGNQAEVDIMRWRL